MTEKILKNYKIVILGGTSDIAIAYLNSLIDAKDNTNLTFYLVGRSNKKLESIRNDFVVKGVSVEIILGDLCNVQHLATKVNAIQNINEVLLAYGELSDQDRSESDNTYLVEQLTVNYLSTIEWIQLFLNKFMKQEFGLFVILGSVAGDLGRKKNFTYGSCKAGVEIFCQGVQHNISKHKNIDLCFFKPGLIRSKMTQHLDTNGSIWTSSDKAGKLIYFGVKKRRRTTYIPGYWRIIMTIIKYLPWSIFKKMNL